jgi:hypothetical protein
VLGELSDEIALVRAKYVLDLAPIILKDGKAIVNSDDLKLTNEVQRAYEAYIDHH